MAELGDGCVTPDSCPSKLLSCNAIVSYTIVLNVVMNVQLCQGDEKSHVVLYVVHVCPNGSGP